MDTSLHRSFSSRTEFAGMLLGRLEAKGFPVGMLNAWAKELWAGSVVLNKRKMLLLMDMCDLSREERSMFEWHYLGGG